MQQADEQYWHRDHPFLATLKSQQRLTSEASTKDVRHIEIDLADSGIHYEPGDTLGVWIRNDPELVDELLDCTQLLAEDKVALDDKFVSLRTMLTEVMEITQAHPGFVKHYAQATSAAELVALCAEPRALRDYLDQRQIIDVVRQYPAALDATTLVACLRHMMPRQYSIASSQRQRARSIELCVGQVVYKQEEAIRKGAGSVYLGCRIQVGERIPVFVIPNPNFRLPADPANDVIMIGPGTGIAPFRAFLQERESTQASGRNWLLFGNPNRASDYLYRGELEAWQSSGLLSRLDLAFSRDQAEKRYVQHCLLEQADELFRWLEGGASLYVCGDARHMAEDVQRTLLQVIAEQGKRDASAARQYLVAMRQQKRYLRDVY